MDLDKIIAIVIFINYYDYMHNFKKLEVWRLAMSVCSNVFDVTRNFPREEKFGLTSQITRSSVSIPSNIAEGSSRRSDREFCRFLDFSLGSSFELETQLILAHQFNYLDTIQFKEIQQKNTEVQRMIYGLQQRLNNTKQHMAGPEYKE